MAVVKTQGTERLSDGIIQPDADEVACSFCPRQQGSPSLVPEGDKSRLIEGSRECRAVGRRIRDCDAERCLEVLPIAIRQRKHGNGHGRKIGREFEQFAEDIGLRAGRAGGLGMAGACFKHRIRAGELAWAFFGPVYVARLRP
nr:hypothetical protein [Sphingomonas bacterium]